VFVFLNELPADWEEQRPSRPSAKVSHPKVGDWLLKAFDADHQGDGGRRVTMKVDNDWNPWMSISSPGPEWDDWILMTTTEPTTMGTEGGPMSRLHDRKLLHWCTVPTALRSRTAWVRNSRFIPVDRAKFHPIVLRLAEKLMRIRVPQTARTGFTFALHHSLVIPRRSRIVLSESTFLASIPGHFHLDIVLRVPGEPFEAVRHGDADYSLLRGWYMSPWAQLNTINGLMLDTTWHVLREYVRSLLMAVYRNVAVPLGFTFGVAETVDLYDQHYGTFAQLFRIELQKYILESDQG
jgi:hypothetical protein